MSPGQSTCHAGGVAGPAGPEVPVVALVGAPNVGKSTLFNALTGARVTMGNWPGTTVEVSRGLGRAGTRAWNLVDLPGAYSLDPVSPDEALTRALLLEGPPGESPDVVVAVVDASSLARGLYLVAQLTEHRLRLVVALTMTDVAARRGLRVDTATLAAELGHPVVAVDPRRRTGLTNLAAAMAEVLDAPVPEPRAGAAIVEPGLPAADRDLLQEDDRFALVDRACSAASHHSQDGRLTLSDRIDRWVTAPVLGPLLFLVVMWAVFQVTTAVAAPLQDGLGGLVSGPVTTAVVRGSALAGLTGTWLEGLVVEGLVAGVGMLLTFVPLMTLMFLLLALLEDSGYLARAAVVTDRVMRAIGLPGRAFLPLVVGFGCNVPAIAATRILPGARDRLLTALLVPFTSCSARLTVYALVGTVFFGRWAGTVVFVLYLVSILFVVGVGALLRSTLWRRFGVEPLLLDLPPYQRPTARLVLGVTWVRLQGFLRTASGIVVVTVCLVWLLQALPADTATAFGEVPVADSWYGRAAQALTPLFQPTGFAAWQTVSALVVGFVAKEAVISSWAQTYAVADPGTGDPGALGDQVVAAFTASSGGHPLPAVAAFLVFLLAYTPCVATLAAQRREIGLRWTLLGVGLQLVVAWSSAVLVFQVGRVFW